MFKIMSRLFSIITIFLLLLCTNPTNRIFALEIPDNDVVWNGNRNAPNQNHQYIRDNMVFDGVNLTVRA